ncbi:MAG: hypothetical protein ABQ298_02490 [Puniceicoccaceae bacterium]
MAHKLLSHALGNTAAGKQSGKSVSEAVKIQFAPNSINAHNFGLLDVLGKSPCANGVMGSLEYKIRS